MRGIVGCIGIDNNGLESALIKHVCVSDILDL